MGIEYTFVDIYLVFLCIDERNRQTKMNTHKESRKDKKTIPTPKVKPGELVLVLNYRCHRKDRKEVWEEGRVYRSEYGMSLGNSYWLYSVELLRLAKSGFHPNLYVCDNDVVKLEDSIPPKQNK